VLLPGGLQGFNQPTPSSIFAQQWHSPKAGERKEVGVAGFVKVPDPLPPRSLILLGVRHGRIMTRKP
jgi:hypothetical protein